MTKTYTEVFNEITKADVIVIGAGAGLSTAGGLTYSGERFEKNFPEFIEKYGLTDMYSSGFYPFESEEERWAYWSKHIVCNRYEAEVGKVYKGLLEAVKDKEYFVITTNVDHQFYKAGFDENQIFATQGDYGELQCSKACHDTLYDAKSMVYKMIHSQEACKISHTLVPTCPVCGAKMDVHIRKDDYFIQNSEWDAAYKRYREFIQTNQNKRILFMELGVGMNTPGIIKYGFWRLVNQLENAFYMCLNKDQAWAPDDIKNKSLAINVDLAKVFG